MPRAAPLALAALAIGCGDSSVLIEVQSDLAGLDAICLSVADSAPAGGRFARRYPLEQEGLPQSLAVAPGSASSAIARVRGHSGGREVGRARAEFDFSSTSVVELSLGSCAPAELVDPEIFEAPGAPVDIIALSRGARRDLLVALGPGEAGAWAVGDGELVAAGGALPEPPAEPRAAIAADVDESCEDDVIVLSERGVERWRRSGDELLLDEAGILDDDAGPLVALAAADIDGDGALDVVAGGGAELRVYLNDGDGRFSRAPDPVPPSAVSDVTSIALADFSGDGRVDILVGQGAAEPGPLRLLLAEPGQPGRFVVAEGATPEVDYVVRQVVPAADPAGVTDALVATSEGVVHLVNRGDGRFDDRSGVTIAGAASVDGASVALGDWDGDCREDVVLAPSGADVRIFAGAGDGGFEEAPGISRVGGRIILDDRGARGGESRDLVIAGEDGVWWLLR